MKKLLTILLLSTSATVFAGPHHGHHHGYWRHGGSNWVWVAPTIIGGVIGYEIARNQPPVVVQQPVIVQQPQIAQQQQNCSPWTEIQNSDGSITRTRTCSQ